MVGPSLMTNPPPAIPLTGSSFVFSSFGSKRGIFGICGTFASGILGNFNLSSSSCSPNRPITPLMVFSRFVIPPFKRPTKLLTGSTRPPNIKFSILLIIPITPFTRLMSGLKIIIGFSRSLINPNTADPKKICMKKFRSVSKNPLTGLVTLSPIDLPIPLMLFSNELSLFLFFFFSPVTLSASASFFSSATFLASMSNMSLRFFSIFSNLSDIPPRNFSIPWNLSSFSSSATSTSGGLT